MGILMKRLLFTAATVVAFAAPAVAADIAARPYTKAPLVVPATIYNWTGFYIGGHVGGAFAGDNNLAGNDGRFLGGVQGGFDYQFSSNVVAGVEAEYSWMNRNNTGTTFPGGTVVTGGTEDQLGSVTGRVGYTWGPGLLYAKGGYAFRDGNNLNVTTAGLPAAFTTSGSHKDGWTVGTGLEYMFAPNWSAKAEYQYYNFGNTTFTTGPAPIAGRRFTDDDHTVKVGVNYRFGWGGPAGLKY
jgi:outer membrane immunogenic protein